MLSKKINNKYRYNGNTAIYNDWTIGGDESMIIVILILAQVAGCITTKPISIYSLTQLTNQIKEELHIYYNLRDIPIETKNFYKEALEWFANLT